MQRIILFFIAVFASLFSSAQVSVNNPVDPADSELGRAVSFMSDYLGEFTGGKKFLPDFNKYWPEQDCKMFRIPDQLLYGINSSIPTYLLGTPKILLVKPIAGYVQIKTMFSRIDSSGNQLVTAITNHYIERDEKGRLHFISPMKLAADKWESTTIRNVRYFFPVYHRFDKKKAVELERRIISLEQEWNLPPINIRYYFADTKEEIEHYRGFDFTIAMGNRDKPTGMSDGIDNIVYCGGWGENYFHEVVHLYLNHLNPKSPLTEGLAVFYGGSLGHELKWHIKRLNEYLQLHPEINLNKLDDFYYMDNFTNPASAIMGMLCLATYEKEGVQGLRRILAIPSVDALFDREYKVKPGEWDRFLRKMITEISEQL